MTKTCPSIPNKQNRFGYSVNNGKIKAIEKNEEIIMQILPFKYSAFSLINNAVSYI